MDSTSYTRGNGLFENFLVKKRADKANSFIDKSFQNGRILDIGCGSYPYFLISSKVKEKYGIDPSLKSTTVKNNNILLKKIKLDSDKLPFEDNFFNVITMLAVFEHIDNTKLNFVLNELKRVLKNDGLFIITTPAPWSDKLLYLMGGIGLISKEEIHEHKSHHKKESIVDILIKSGFEQKKIKSGYFELGFNMWFVVSK